jgi:sugar phosphate isomerase/epimerase
MTMRSSVTISLVNEVRGGPFVFWDDLTAGIHKAARLGFDAVEVFSAGAEAFPADELRRLLADTGLKLAAVGTGAGWVIRKLTLTHPDAGHRAQARQFIAALIDQAGPFGAPVIIGSMQGRWGDGTDKATALGHLAEALQLLGVKAAEHRVSLIFEPLNRYETNLVNTITEGIELLRSLTTTNVVLLADLFHMNIEEVSLPDALRAGARHIGHVHLADSNRRPAGSGHTDFAPVAAALRDIDYNGYVSAEALPYPNPDEAAQLTIEAFRKHFAPCSNTN